MSTKTPGQIAYEGYCQNSTPPWRDAVDHSEWESSAAAVIAHHEAQKDPFAELKAAYAAGKVIQYRHADWHEWTDIYQPSWKSVLLCYRIKPEQPRPPTNQITITLPTLTLTSGRLSFAAV